MKKIAAIMVLIGIIATFAGCTTTRYSVQIAGVPNISSVQIRNAGTTHWGANLAARLGDIDVSQFSDRVDIRVVDTNGIVHSRYNVPFHSDAFTETRQRHSGTGTAVMGGIVLLGGLIALIALAPDADAAMAALGGFQW